MQLSDLNNLSTQEKLQAMETLWDALCNETASTVPSPEWHQQILQTRNASWKTGEQTATAWQAAKQHIKDKSGPD